MEISGSQKIALAAAAEIKCQVFFFEKSKINLRV
jgi:hypothetical protein